MQHVLAGEHIISSDRIADLSRSLPALGSGVTRTAYDLGNGSVLKVQHESTFSYSHGNRTEVEMWERVKDTVFAEHFAEILAYDEENYAWIIQRKADRTATIGELDRFWNLYGIDIDSQYGIGSDLHKRNLGVMEDENGEAESFVIIDYAISYVAKAYSPTCNCGDIDCHQCGCGVANGECGCPTLAGHRQDICHVSDCFSTAMFRIWVPTWFQDEYGTQGACALDHAPIGHKLGHQLREIAGQQSFSLGLTPERWRGR